MNGFIIVNKPVSFTSNDVVVMIRGALKKKGYKVKVGHLGTLDPNATGVLPISIGKATRLFDFYLKKDKEYIAEFTFGHTTDTFDACGKFTSSNDKISTFEEFSNAINSLVGKYLQIPPIYCAKSINGRKAYDLAREGTEVNLEPKEVEIYSVSDLSKLKENVMSAKICCSSGTYIRAIARDLAIKMDTVGYMSALIRTRAGNFVLSEASHLNCVLSGDVTTFIKPILDYLPLERYALDESLSKKALNGIKIELNNPPMDTFALLIGNELIGLAKYDNGLNIITRLG